MVAWLATNQVVASRKNAAKSAAMTVRVTAARLVSEIPLIVVNNRAWLQRVVPYVWLFVI